MKVATYQPNQVQMQSTPGHRISGASGAASLQATNNMVKAGAQVAIEGAKMVQRIDTTAAEEALVAFEKGKNELFFNPESGYFNTQGKNAYDQATGANKALEALKRDYGEKLTPNARAMFDKSADAHILNGQKDIMLHSSKGLNAWEVATINASVENTVENASLYWNQPDQLRVQSALGRQSVIDAAGIEGVGSEVLAERLQTYDSSFYKAAVTSAVMKSSTDGKALFEKFGNRLEGPDRIKIEAAIGAKAKAENTQYEAQYAVTHGASLVEQYDDRESIRQEVNKISNTELRAKTMSEAMRQFNYKKKAMSEAQMSSFDDAEGHLLEGGSAETFKAKDPAGWERLSAKQKKSLSKGKSVSTDWVTYIDLVTLPQAELAKVDPADYISVLAPSERNKLITAVRSASGKGSSTEKVDHQVGRTRNSQTTNAVEQLFGKKSKWNDEKRRSADAFYELLNSEVDYRERSNGAPLTSQEFTDTLADLTRSVIIEDAGFMYFDAEQSVTDIPDDELTRLADKLRADNLPVTTEWLLKLKQAEDNHSKK